jgi:hypothetical protein
VNLEVGPVAEHRAELGTGGERLAIEAQREAETETVILRLVAQVQPATNDRASGEDLHRETEVNRAGAGATDQAASSAPNRGQRRRRDGRPSRPG